ncbi:hypothetical protein BH10BAC2_BH10BAC2_38620 [soil metagenome]
MNKDTNDKLGKSEAKFRHLIMQAPVAMSVILGPSFHVEIANKKQLEIWQKEEAEVLHKPLFVIFPELKSHEFDRLLTEVYQTGIAFTGKEIPEQLLRNGTLETSYYDFIYEPLRNEMGEMEGITVVSIDVSEKVLARKQIEGNEIFNRTILESSPDCLKVLDSDGRIQFMNFNGLCQMEIDDFFTIKNTNWFALWGSDNEALVKASVDKALTGETAHFTAFCPTVKGTPKWWDVLVSPIGKPGEAVRQIISVSRDITEQKKAEEKIHESETRFRSLAKNSPDMIVQMDKHLRYTYVSPILENMMGIKSEKFIGKTYREMGFPEDMCIFFDEQLAITTQKKQHEVEYIGLKGEDAFTRVVAEPDKRGDLNSFLIITTDVTKARRSERQLQKQVIHLKLATESANVGTWSLDIKTQKLEWSALHKKMWGYDEDGTDLTYEEWHKLILQEDKEKAFKKVEEARINHSAYDVEYRIGRANDKVIRWMRSVGQYYYNEAGEADTLTGISLDITEQKEGEHKLKASEELFRLLTLNSPDVITRLDKDGRYLYASPSIIKLTGKNAEEFIGRSYREMDIPEAICELFDKSIALVLQQKKMHTIEFNAANGYSILSSRLVPEINEKGEAVSVMMIHTDITEHKLAEDKLKGSETKFKTLAEALPHLVWMTDEKGKYEYASDSWMQYSGLDPHLDETWQQLVHPGDMNSLMNTWSKSLSSGQPYVTDARLKNKKGEYRWHVVHGEAIKNKEGEIIKWIGAFTDIHEQKMIEEQKDEFISIASHEMKTPLTTAKGYIELLLLSLSEENETALYATKANQAVERLNNLVTELLDSSKVQNGQLDYTNTTFDFNELVEETLKNFQLSAKNHKLQKTGNCLRQINADRGRLQQVLINLLSNAIKYSPKADKVLIKIEERDDKIQVSVQDFGVGMSGKHLDKIFDRYYRVLEHAIHFQGLGIGLYISKNIIEKHEGILWAESEPEKGSTFYFTLPV